MEETRKIVYKHPIKKIKVHIKNSDIEIPAYFSIDDMQLYIEEVEESRDYKKALSAVILGKVHIENENYVMDDILGQDEKFFLEFILGVVEGSKELKKVFDETPERLPVIERFGIAYQNYLTEMTESLGTALKPIAECCTQIIKSINFSEMIRFQEAFKYIGAIVADGISKIGDCTQKMVDTLKPFQQAAEKILQSILLLNIPGISKEEITQWEENYRKWGQVGWTILPNAPINFYKSFPKEDANRLAMNYCDKETINSVFNGLMVKKINKKDLESAIFCYNNRQYKACALLLFSILDSILIKMQPKKSYRKVGLGATSLFEKQLNEGSGEKQILLVGLYQINLLTGLYVFFAKGDNFIDEPEVINRNYVAHGMNKRDVRKRDCVQLILMVYNLCEFIEEFV